MEITGYFENDGEMLNWINFQRDFLPKEVVLSDAGVDEGKVSEKSIIDNPIKFQRFLEENRYGLFLFNKIKKSVSANVSFSIGKRLPYVNYFQDDSKSQILLKNAHSIIESYAACDALYGFGCLDSERRFKNRIYVKLGMSEIEQWVGRDIQKYLPGIYWINFISSKYASKHSLPIKEIASSIKLDAKSHSKGYILQMGNDPTLWQAHLDEISKYSATRDNMFSVDKVVVSSIKSRTDLDRIAEMWP